MPFARPTLTQLRNQVAQDLNASLPGADALLRFSNLHVLGDIQAALAHMLYGYLDWIAFQATPITSTDEYLEAWGALKGLPRKGASQSSGTVIFKGNDGLPVAGIAVVVAAFVAVFVPVFICVFPWCVSVNGLTRSSATGSSRFCGFLRSCEMCQIRATPR
ncbi:baseplate J/gp47 family protein [Paraburkholderia sediminicola]|uniref:hypothetical protein n=1 Tax=Paraburkholderia sediminicola TaxID=458836 RepID=UPI0038B910AC